MSLSVFSFYLIKINSLPFFARIFIFFVVINFTQWCTHRLIHRVPFLWNFHKVHHSVKQIGFTAHLRYHWMEPILYSSLRHIPLAIIGGFSAQDVALIHFFNIMIGHLNQANIHLDYGLLKYILNNLKMHSWHHSKVLPTERKYGLY